MFETFQSTPTIVAVEDECAAEGLIGLLDRGACDFLLSPFDAARVYPRVLRLLHHNGEEDAAAGELKAKLGLKMLVGQSPLLVAELQKIPMMARCDATALITGETGTGKELCARAIHYCSGRSAKPFVSVNCGAIPCDLVENELFGHETGAFTGATTSSSGLVHEAEGGTLFLDEVDSLPLLAQVKLLRLLQEKEYRRLGSRKTCTANVRVVAAANCRLEEAVREKRFRQDLFYRLSMMTISLPPLRERIGDITLLATHFARKYAQEFGKSPKRLSNSALQRLLGYHWPGNVRELENLMARSVMLVEASVLDAHDLPLAQGGPSLTANSFRELKATVVAQFEQRYLTELLTAFDGNISKAAQAAHKNRRAFWELMRKHHIRSSVAA
jgi:DNA-binding NtrC family response regulator